MPIDITQDYFRVRQNSPGKYIRMRTRWFPDNVTGRRRGIKAIFGVRKDGKTEVQSLLFSRASRYGWTLVKVKAWLREHGFKIPAGGALSI